MSNLFASISSWVEICLLEAWHKELTAPDKTIYAGTFMVKNQGTGQRYTIPGRIFEAPDTPAGVYLHQAPSALWRHPHGRCFQLVSPGSGWVKLHWKEPAYDFITARNYVKSMLVEALRSAN